MKPGAATLRLAVVEDEEDLRESMVDFLRMQGYLVWGAPSGEALYRRLLIEPIDVLILDLGLPGEDGFAVTRHVSQLGIPVIILSGRNTLADRLTGLEAGADRYLVKPLDLLELVANIEAVRRPVPVGRGAGRDDLPWRLDTASWALHAPDGKTLPLTSREYALIHCLAAAGGASVGKGAIAETLWVGSSDCHRIDVILTRLRNKGAEALGRPLPIKTIQSRGLVLTVNCVIR
jgi:DNA-binding response OmpR family regulator